MYALSWILKKIDNSGMELLKYLKFGTLIALFDVLKIIKVILFECLTVKTIITESIHFHWESQKSTLAVTTLSQTCGVAKLLFFTS